MKIILINPPSGDPTRPYLSTPTLAGSLRNAGYNKIKQFDFALDAFLYVLQPRVLRQAQHRVSYQLEQMNKAEFLEGEDHLRWTENVRAKISAPHVIHEIPKALDDMRDWNQFNNRHFYHHNMATIQRAEELVSTMYFPSRFYAPGIYASRFVTFSTQGLMQGAHDTEENVFLDFFHEKAVPQVVAYAPQVVMVSANHSGQLIPALTLAQLLRKTLPQTHLHLWGNYTYFYADLFPDWIEFFDFFQSVAPFDFEYGSSTTCLKLVRAIETDGDLSTVPGIFYKNDSNRVVATIKSIELEDPAVLAKTSFDGLPLDNYLSPKLVLPLALTIGCHWGRCTFCTRRRSYRSRAPEDLVNQMAGFSERYDCSHFYLADDGIPTDLMNRFCRLLVDGTYNFRWFAMVRPDKGFDRSLTELMRQAGCRHVFMGLESASQRLLNLMVKGTNINQVKATLKNFSEADISIILSAFVGFPSETEEEARQTLEFLIESKPWVTNVVCERYLLQSGTPVYEKPARYGIDEIVRAPDQAGYDLRFKTKIGMSWEQIQDLSREFQRVINHAFPKPNLQTLLLDYSHCAHTLLQAQLPRRPVASPDPVISLTASSQPEFSSARHEIHELRFPLEKVFMISERMKDATLNQGHQQWSDVNNTETDVPDKTMSKRSYCLYSESDDNFIELSETLVRLLDRCNGETSVEQIVAQYPQKHRKTIETLLEKMLAKGILTSERKSIP